MVTDTATEELSLGLNPAKFSARRWALAVRLSNRTWCWQTHPDILTHMLQLGNRWDDVLERLLELPDGDKRLLYCTEWYKSLLLRFRVFDASGWSTIETCEIHVA